MVHQRLYWLIGIAQETVPIFRMCYLLLILIILVISVESFNFTVVNDHPPWPTLWHRGQLSIMNHSLIFSHHPSMLIDMTLGVRHRYTNSRYDHTEKTVKPYETYSWISHDNGDTWSDYNITIIYHVRSQTYRFLEDTLQP